MKKLNMSLLSSILTVFLAGNISGVAQAAQLTSENMDSVERSTLQIGQQYYISGDALNLRSSNSTAPGNVVGKLALNDVVEISSLLDDTTPLVQVKVVKSAVKTDGSVNYFVSKDFLSDKPVAISNASKYFVVQNVASEKTRVYERCTTSPSCPHKMIFETDMVVGRPEEGTETDPSAYATWVGHAKISEWVKFYQDGMAHYPHWYRAGQDIKTIPRPITDSFSKLLGARKWIVRGMDGQQTIYGAFGWYAAKLTPADEREGMNYQWMHGAIGWGKDGSVAIQATRTALLNMVSNPGSSGCTRLENRAIAYLRSLLPVGTDIYRIYAREAYRDLTPYAGLENYPAQWSYILTTNDAQKSGGLEADAQALIRKAIMIDATNMIERGTYDVDRYPTVAGLNYQEMPSSGKSGDRYKIDSGVKRDAWYTNFQGYYLVDEGRLVDYRHPSLANTKGRVRTSGMADFRNSVPEFLTAPEGLVTAPPVIYR
jgi:hypothetical protein